MALTSADPIIERDRKGYVVLEAITHAGFAQSQTLSKTDAFICIDGETYWVKADAQQGLVAELIAGRLAERIGVGPAARIVRLTPEARPQDGSADHLDGTIVGSRGELSVINAKELTPLLANGQFAPGIVDPLSRARVIAFQTWIGVADSQVLIRGTDGRVLSIDHGDCFGNVDDQTTPPTMILTSIPGVGTDVGQSKVHLLDAISRIEAIREEHIVEAVSQIPVGGIWRSPVERRLGIAQWLIARQSMLRGVMEAWMV